MIPNKLELKGTMHGAAIVDGRGDIKAVIDPGVQSVAMMRSEDIALGELFCQAPTMAKRITQLTTDYAEIQQIRDAELSSLYRLREHLKELRERYNCSEHICEPISKLLAETPEQSVIHIRVAELRRMSKRLVEDARNGRENDYGREADGMVDAAVTLDDEADRLERDAGS